MLRMAALSYIALSSQCTVVKVRVSQSSAMIVSDHKKLSPMVTHFPIRNENFEVNERAERANHRESPPYSNKSVRRNEMMMKFV